MTADTAEVRSALPGMTWPGLPAGPGATLLGLLHQLDQTQWWSPDQLRRRQFHQLDLLLRHARETVPFYRERLDAAGYRPGMEITAAWFGSLPPLARADVHAQGDGLHSTSIPAGHAPVMKGQTSGSTGMPVTFLTTGVTQLFWHACGMREHLWHGRDLRLKLAAIRPDRGMRGDEGANVPSWGEPLGTVFRNGPACILHSSNSLDRQIEWLVAQNPDYLLMLASNLLEIAREMSRRGIRLPRLREARSFGDTLTPAMREEAAGLLGVKVVDSYSSQEVGYIATQCPLSDHYHVHCEGVIVELLDERGHPVPEGGMGKVVVTTLHNFAMPLVRYEIGDYAEAGGRCPCGRGLPVIRRVLGRERNLAVAPDGRKYYPSFAAEVWSGIAPIRQIQIVQKSRRHMEVRFVAPRDLDDGERAGLTAALRGSLGHPYDFTFVRLDVIPRTSSGKYEDFMVEPDL